MATTKIDIHKAVDPLWLIRNKCVLILPKNPVHKVRLCAIIWGKIPKDKRYKQIQMFLDCTEGIAERHLYKYYKFNFAFNQTTIGKKLSRDEKKVESLKKESFNVEIRDLLTGLARYHFRISSSKIEDIEKDPGPQFDLVEINELRNREMDNDIFDVDRSPEEIDDLGMKISKLVATGVYSIYEACEKCGVKWLEFMTWYTENNYIYEMYNQAIKIARFFKNSSYETMADKMLFELLQYGKTQDVAVEYDMVYNEMNPEGFFIPNKKRTLDKQHTLRDLLELKKTIQNISDPIQQSGEFESMSNDELAVKIKEMEAAKQKALQKRKRNIEKK